MKISYFLIPLGFVSMILVSCSPQLAKTDYGPEEQQWKDYIQKSYNAWEPPTTPAPLSDNKVSESIISAVDTIPEASESDGTFVETEVLSIQEEVPAADGTTAQPGSTYTVQKGDTLWSIAQQIYGNGNSWTVIRDANKDILGDSNALKAGMILKIPPSGK